MKIENCVLGVYETLNGLDIAGEMSIWLKKYYKLFKVTQEPIEGNLCEYPALLFASDFCMGLNEPVLYVHTKGAANTTPVQEVVRTLWKREFKQYKGWYEEQIEGDEPKVICPITTNEEIAWYNGFVMNPAAAKIIHDRLTIEDRYFYEKKLLVGSGIKVIGHYEAEKLQVTKKMFETLGIPYTIKKPTMGKEL